MWIRTGLVMPDLEDGNDPNATKFTQRFYRARQKQ